MIFINMILIFENAMLVYLLQNNNILATMSLSRYLVNKRVGSPKNKKKSAKKQTPSYRSKPTRLIHLQNTMRLSFGFMDYRLQDEYFH